MNPQTAPEEKRAGRPINQAIAVLRSTSKPEPARKFTEFITSSRAKKVLQRYGYE